MSDIFEEVDEAVQQDRAARWWKRLGPFVYAGVAVLVIGVAVNEFLNWQKDQDKANAADAFYTAQQAFEQPDYVLSKALFEEIAKSDNPYQELAGHYLAQVNLVGFGDRPAALEALKAAAEGDGPFADAARMKAAYMMSDTAELADLLIWLDPLLNNIDSSYTNLAEEVIASREFELGKLEDAKRRFERISFSLETSQSLRGRAERAAAAIDAILAKEGNAS